MGRGISPSAAAVQEMAVSRSSLKEEESGPFAAGLAKRRGRLEAPALPAEAWALAGLNEAKIPAPITPPERITATIHSCPDASRRLSSGQP